MVGALYGLRAWLIYAVVELIFTAYLPWLLQRHIARPRYLSYMLAALLVYAVVGITIGAACGLTIAKLRPPNPLRTLNAITTALLVMAFSANAFSVEDYLLSPRILILPVLFLGAVASASSSVWGTRLTLFGNPWVAALLCVGVQWLTRDYLNESGRFYRLMILMSYVGLLFVLGWLFERRSRSTRSDWPLSSVAFTGVLTLIIAAGAMALHPAPIRRDIRTGAMPAGKHTNVIMVVLDTVRADHLSLYGYDRETTPNLRQLARRATLYQHSYSTGDMTLPSHASIFTGLYPSQHRAHYSLDAPVGRPLAQSHITLAEILASQGYKTLAVVANGGYLTSTFGFDQGFAVYDQRLPAVPMRSSPPYVLKSVILTAATRLLPEIDMCNRSRTAQEITASVHSLLDERPPATEQPLFLFVNYMDAHYPYLPPEPFDKMFPAKDEHFTDIRYGDIWENTILRNQAVPAADQMHLISQYDGGIAYIDFQLGKLIERLKKLKLYDDSLLIVTSDHGEYFGERNLLDHGGMSVYQDQVAVPLLIKYPGQTQSEIIDSNVSGVDLFPTVLDVLGFPIPKSAQGKSLAKLEAGEERTLFCESFPGGRALKTNPDRFKTTHQAILRGSFKLIRRSDGRRELYDLAKDPGERNNLYQNGHEPGADLDARLSRWSRSLAAASDKHDGKFDSETLERLKSLGYVQ
jgi:arylsulfatase A-like enzyme